MEASYRSYVDVLTERIHRALPELVTAGEPASLYAPARYVLEAPGKRLRPLLLLLSAGLFDVPEAEAMPAALALEVFHTFTLVHDDIMDHAASRRGCPTVHERWDEGTAILCGDWLMGLSYDLLTRVERGNLRAILKAYHTMVTRLCEGQALDREFEGRQDVTLDEYMHMISCKTGALIETAMVIGGLIGEAEPEALQRLQTAGWHLGRAFQLQDDLLDLTARDAGWGKPIGGDLIEGKKTYLLLRALEKAQGDDRTFFERIVREGGLEPERVPEARARMERMGILEETRRKAVEHYAVAEDALEGLPEGQALGTLRWLLKRMSNRVR